MVDFKGLFLEEVERSISGFAQCGKRLLSEQLQSGGALA